MAWILRTATGDGADGRVHNRIKIVKKHGPWNRGHSTHRIVGDRDGICRLTASTHPAATSTALSFDFMSRCSLWGRTTAAATSFGYAG